MSDAPSFYPPRARWHSPARYRYARFRKLLLNLQCPLAAGDIVGSLVIPGFSFRAYRRDIGNAAMIVYWVSALSFFIWFGHLAGNWTFAMMLAIHVSSIAFLIKRLGPDFSLKFKIFSVIVFLFVLNTWIYMPLREWISHYIIPMRMGTEVIVTKRCLPKNIKRGDWIMYDMKAGIHDGIVLQAGFGFSPVLAAAGDTVSFGKTNFWINTNCFSSQAYMPASGTIVVQEKQWFVWPALGITGNRALGPELTEILQAHSLVTEETFVGKPFKRWFWRKQQVQP